MYIENIKIGNFGKLSNREFDLTCGVNILEGRNESGKSTLCEFIKFVFYGLSNKSLGGEMSERKRHISWKTNGVSGSIVLNCGEKCYRIERSMIAHGAGYKDEITVVDLEKGSVSEGIKNPGEYFFGVPEEVFTKTVYIRQNEGAYFNGGDIGQAVENIFYSADESINTDKALKKLDDARVMIRHKKNTGRGMLDSLERERDELTERLIAARQVNESIMQNESSLGFAVSAVEKNKKDCEKMEAQMRKTELHYLLSKFAEKKKIEKQIAEFERGEKQVVEAMTFDGFFPTREYGEELEKAQREVEFLVKELDSASDVSDCGEAAGYSKEQAEYIEEQGGKLGISELLDYLKKQKKRFLFVGLGLIALGVILACVAIIYSNAFGNMGRFLYMGGTVLALSAVVSFVLSHRAKNKIYNLFDFFEAEDEESLMEAVSKTEAAESYDRSRAELLKYRELQKNEVQKKLSVSISSACTLLEKWGIVPENLTADAVIGCMNDAVSDINEISNNIDIYRKEIEKNEAVLSVVAQQLQGYDEKVLKEEYDSIEFDFDPDAQTELKKRFDFVSKAKESLLEKVSTLEKTLVELKSKSDDVSNIESRLQGVNERIKELEFKHEAYVLAYEKLQKAGANLRNKLAPGLSLASGKLMAGLTDGKYAQIGVSDNLEMTYTFEDEGSVYTKTIDSVSSGTQDIAYISLRLALAEMFGSSGEKLPVVFDESFSRLDNIRLKNMLIIADRYAENSQVLIMTSHNREAEIISDIPNFKNVNLLSL
ncbi:MAG: AAA family ATPase [Clostridia bacterium]|nr:AAA family ATPase [Clostridia bacterium]